MKALLQRVAHASVVVDGEILAAIGPGLLVFLAVERGDTEAQARRLVERVLGYRVFCDAAGKMNDSLTDTGGGLLVISQFTLAADTKKGMRPSFTPAAPPEDGERLYEVFLAEARRRHGAVGAGRFGADMKVSLLNDGPVTIWLECAPDLE
ncbi:MAG: D-tyrosyl-tRNA(Tyr) deacylase [Gammaproteobacteria bacterium]|nr:D-tyrosyl-tRNA(Tyr) deacylase [Gammaproteobacteria bacterium]